MFDHDVFWIAGIGVLNLAVAVELIASSMVPRLRDRSLVLARAAAVVLLVIAAAAGAWRLQDVARRSTDPPAEARAARAVADDLLAFMDREHVARPMVRIDQDAWGIAAGAILELQKHKRFVSVEDDWVVMFTPVFARTGGEDAVVTIAAPPEHVRLAGRGVPMLAAHEPVYIHVERP